MRKEHSAPQESRTDMSPHKQFVRREQNHPRPISLQRRSRMLQNRSTLTAPRDMQRRLRNRLQHFRPNIWSVEEAYVNLRMRLAWGLNEQRQSRNITRADLAGTIESSPVSRRQERQATSRCPSTCSYSRSLRWVRRIANWRRSCPTVTGTFHSSYTDHRDAALCTAAGVILNSDRSSAIPYRCPSRAHRTMRNAP